MKNVTTDPIKSWSLVVCVRRVISIESTRSWSDDWFFFHNTDVGYLKFTSHRCSKVVKRDKMCLATRMLYLIHKLFRESMWVPSAVSDLTDLNSLCSIKKIEICIELRPCFTIHWPAIHTFRWKRSTKEGIAPKHTQKHDEKEGNIGIARERRRKKNRRIFFFRGQFGFVAARCWCLVGRCSILCCGLRN